MVFGNGRNRRKKVGIGDVLIGSHTSMVKLGLQGFSSHKITGSSQQRGGTWVDLSA